MKLTRMAAVVTSVVAAGALLAGCSGSPSSSSSSGSSDDPLAALVEKANAEGSLTVYASAAESTIQDLLAAFNKQYPDIQTDYFRGAGTALFNRFQSEAEAGTTAADVFMPTIQPSFITDHADWFTKLDDDVLPGYSDWPADFKTDYTVQTVVEEVTVLYNTNNVKNPPKSWQDVVASDQYKGKIVLLDPTSSPSYMSWYEIMRQKFGDDFLRKLAALDPVYVDTGATGAQQVANGSMDLMLPAYPSHATALIAQGAPLDMVTNLDPTQGITTSVAITSGAPHPNAAALFAHWMTTKDAFNAYCSGGMFSAVIPGTDCQQLASNYVQPIWDISQAEKDQIVSLLGR